MADITPILIKDLAEQTAANDADYMVIGGSDAKKIKWSTIWGLIRDKLGIGTATLSTTDKTVKGAINEIKTSTDNKIEKSSIVQNATTAATDRVPSAAVAKALQDQITEQNTNTEAVDPYNTPYVHEDIDATIDQSTNMYRYVFGHSNALSAKCGYWVFVITIAVGSPSDWCVQLAIGEKGRANRVHSPSTGWSEWI